MVGTKLLRAEDSLAIVTLVNVAKRLDIAIKGLTSDIEVKKKEVVSSVRALFDAGLGGDERRVYSNFKIESTKLTAVDGVAVEVPDGIVQCQMKMHRKVLTVEEIALGTAAGEGVLTELTENAQVVDLVDTLRVLRFLTANPARVSVTANGGSLSISLVGDAQGVDGVTFKTAVLPNKTFLESVSNMAPEKFTAARAFITSMLTRLDPTIVFGNRGTH